jgi:5-methylcytosine-specific restriction endonuclease McrA
MTKKEHRLKVFNKYGGRCAYCGCEITTKNFQVDHIWPQQLKHWCPDLDNNRFENLNPSCRKCNNFKHGMKLGEFRAELQRQVSRLKKNSQFDRALRYDQVKIQESPIVFYFERFIS